MGPESDMSRGFQKALIILQKALSVTAPQADKDAHHQSLVDQGYKFHVNKHFYGSKRHDQSEAAQARDKTATERMHAQGYPTVHVTHPSSSEPIARLSTSPASERHQITIGGASIHPDHRRKGLATAMYNLAAKTSKKEIVPSGWVSDDARHFWSRYGEGGTEKQNWYAGYANMSNKEKMHRLRAYSLKFPRK